MDQRTDVTETRALDKVIRTDETQVHSHLGEIVRSSVEERYVTRNAGTSG